MEIKNKKEAINAFINEFGSLARALNPAAPAFDGYDFVKYTISINGSAPLKAYVAHNTEANTSFVVPCDGNTPSIEDFDNIVIIRVINTAKQAKEAFIQEYGSLARALNPAAPAYDGYVFEKRKISVSGNTFKAFIASDTAQTTTFVVPTSGEKISIIDYKDVKILD